MRARIRADIRAVRLVARNHPLSDRDRGHTLTDGFNHTRGFVSEDARELAFAIKPTKRVRIGVTERSVGNLHANFPRSRRRDDDVDELEGFTRLKGYSSLARDGLTDGG